MPPERVSVTGITVLRRFVEVFGADGSLQLQFGRPQLQIGSLQLQFGSLQLQPGSLQL